MCANLNDLPDNACAWSILGTHQRLQRIAKGLLPVNDTIPVAIVPLHTGAHHHTDANRSPWNHLPPCQHRPPLRSIHPMRQPHREVPVFQGTPTSRTIQTQSRSELLFETASRRGTTASILWQVHHYEVLDICPARRLYRILRSHAGNRWTQSDARSSNPGELYSGNSKLASRDLSHIQLVNRPLFVSGASLMPAQDRQEWARGDTGY